MKRQQQLEHPPAGVAVFDVIGTLVDPAPIRSSFTQHGLPEATFEAWFARMLHAAATMTIVDQFPSFAELAKSSLETTLVMAEADPAGGADLIRPLLDGCLPPYPDAVQALDLLAQKSIPIYALTNGSAQQTSVQLRNAGLDRFDAEIVSTEEVRVYKPHSRVYQRLLERADVAASGATLVAAHGWDIVGATAAGLGAIWVSRAERRWPFPTQAPAAAPTLLEAARLLTTGSFAIRETSRERSIGRPGSRNAVE